MVSAVTQSDRPTNIFYKLLQRFLQQTPSAETSVPRTIPKQFVIGNIICSCCSTADWCGGEQQYKKTCRYVNVDTGNKEDRWQVQERDVGSRNRETQEEFLPPSAIYPIEPRLLASCSVTTIPQHPRNLTYKPNINDKTLLLLTHTYHHNSTGIGDIFSAYGTLKL